MATTTFSPQDLPIWMRRARRGTDWGVLLALILSLLAASTFLTQPGLPRTNASERFVFMASDFAAALHEGRLYPRWSPNALDGYGAPIPNFYPPGAAYTAALADIVLTGNAVDGVRLVYTLALCLAGAVTYTLVARRASAPAGMIAAALYLFSPYVGLTAPHLLGDLPGVLGLALLPTLLWAVDRLLVGSQPHDLLLVALAGAGLLLTDPRLAAVGVGMTAAYCAWLPQPDDRRWQPVLGGLLLGGLISAFYWLPAVVEAYGINWYATPGLAQPPLSLGGLLTPLLPADPDALMPAIQWTLGLTGVVGAVLGVGALIAVRAAARFEGVFLLIGAALAGLALVIMPSETWLLGPISLCFAVGASAIWRACARLPQPWRRSALPTLLVAILAGALPVWSFSSAPGAFENPTPQAQIDYEQNGFGIAALPPGAPLASNVGVSPTPNRALLNGYQAGVVDKIDPASLPRDIQIGVLAHESHSDRFSARAGSAAQIKLLTAYFPGWTASMGSMEVPLRRASPDGLISLSLPAATGELLVNFGATPIRTAAWGISWAALALLLAVTWRRFRRSKPSYDHPPLLAPAQSRLLALVVGTFAAVVLIAGRAGALTPRPGYLLDGSTTLRSHTDVGLEALAYRIDNHRYHPGDLIEFSMNWRALRPLANNITVRAELVSATPGVVYAPTALHPPGGYPTRRWLTGRYVADRIELPIPPGAARGDYIIGIEAFTCSANCASDNRLTFFDSTGAETGQVLLLPTLLTIE